MGWIVDRQFEVCEVCRGKIQVDTHSSPGEVEDGPALLTTVKLHIGSCTPPPSEEVIADNSNVAATLPAAPPPTEPEKASKAPR